MSTSYKAFMDQESMSAGQLLKQANKLKRSGRLDEAIALYHQVIEINPNFAWAYSNLGDAFAKQGKLDEAIAFYSQSLKSYPHSAWFFCCMGEALAKQGDLEAAVKYLKKAINLKSNFYRFYHSLGQVLTLQENFYKAITNYRRAIKLQSENASSYLGCFYAYLCLGNLTRAKEYFIPALKLAPKNAKVKLYASFLTIMDGLDTRIRFEFKTDIQSFIDNFSHHQTPKGKCDRHLGKILKLVLAYEELASQKDLMLPELHEFHFRISDIVLEGADYTSMLKNLHLFLKPKTYVEIGVETGRTFQLAGLPTISIGIDPQPKLNYQISSRAKVFTMTSDEFFQSHNVLANLKGRTVDFAFIDGLHLFEQALKDFINLEKYSSKNAVICFHDTFPLDEVTSRRKRSTRFWTGDVWKIVPILKEYRPDIKVLTVATRPTGLTIVTNLDPRSKLLSANYDDIVNKYLDLNWVDNLESRYEMLSVVNNNWPSIQKRFMPVS